MEQIDSCHFQILPQEMMHLTMDGMDTAKSSYWFSSWH